MALTDLDDYAQGAINKGRVEVYDLGTFKLHVYYTNDPLADTSYIVEGEEGLVTLEHPLLRENAKEFDSYAAGLKKPVRRIITDYHVGSTAGKSVIMPEGMPTFTKEPVYAGMMENFARIFGDTMTELPTGTAEEIAFGTTVTWVGIPFTFNRGAATDFPGASIIIGGKVYYTHWTPSKAHVSSLQISSGSAVDAEIAEAQRELDSGCELFIGGHGGAATMEAVEFKIAYLQTVKRLASECFHACEFAEALKIAFPGLIGEEGVDELASSLYAKR